ncbi:hypothetical protein T440DRAFT_528687 [Plenodomus tracheiphilus IPT5]|uniref:Uncharacterized protein n=1 Tax=Plenodomus tracheiphilus IPT5 TaxID=1408161 RepID=A0A6A7B7J4_9PLEO|nr:hypothetical protein T440DRAFT_528687 [Plenodomus tracheiphilus IPT5]
MHCASRAFLSLLALAIIGLAQITPFSVTGSLDSCTVSGTDYNSGGTITVNNWSIRVPQNLIVQLPVVWTPFPELCNAGALGFETTVVGNVVNNEVIAGQISVAQRFGLEGSQGFISAINSDGTLQIGGGGPRVRINDPDGLFGPKVDTNKYWVADTGSPSVTSFSGFPMCIPYSGNAGSCLSSNRPNGNSFRPADPLRMVPFKVGDFIEYSGLKIGSNELLASTIVCPSLHITTTASNTEPNYIRVEEFLVGVPDNAANVEFADIRVVGFLSSCSGATVTISAIEVDACTGEEKYRQIGTATPRQETRCKFDARIAPQAQAPFTREYRITTNSPVIKTKDGIEAGKYVQPVTEWIFPEVDVPGTFPPSYIFTDIRGLVQGDFLDGKQYGPLSPFPGANPPAPAKKCSPADVTSSNNPTTPASPDPSTPQTAPVASIAQITTAQRIGVEVALVGSNTAQGLSANDLVFKWVQTSPTTPSISITNSDSVRATFIGPKVTTEMSFNFELTICLKSNTSSCSKATTTVRVSATAPDTVTMDLYGWQSRQGGTITVSCSSNMWNGDNKAMTLVMNNGATSIRMSGGLGTGKWTYSSRSTSRPTNLKCVSDLKGESTTRIGTATTRRRRAAVQ